MSAQSIHTLSLKNGRPVRLHIVPVYHAKFCTTNVLQIIQNSLVDRCKIHIVVPSRPYLASPVTAILRPSTETEIKSKTVFNILVLSTSLMRSPFLILLGKYRSVPSSPRPEACHIFCCHEVLSSVPYVQDLENLPTPSRYC